MEDVRTDEARRLLATAFETVPVDPAAAGDGMLRMVRRQHARRRRARRLVSAGAPIAAAGAAVVVLLSATAAGAPPALAAVTGAVSRAAAESFRMHVTVTEHDTVPVNQPTLRSPLRMSGKFDLKRNLGEEVLSNGWQTRIVGGTAYTKITPREARLETGGKLWTKMLQSDAQPPYPSSGAQLAWDFNSDRPFNPQALLALLRSGATVRDEGSVSGTGWSGTRYRFSVSHPVDIVHRVTCTVDVDASGHIRRFVQVTAFSADGTPRGAGEMIFTLDFTFSDFGVRFVVTPPPASQVDPDLGAAVQY